MQRYMTRFIVLPFSVDPLALTAVGPAQSTDLSSRLPPIFALQNENSHIVDSVLFVLVSTGAPTSYVILAPP